MRIFAEREFSAVAQAALQKLRVQINNEDQQHILNVNRTQYIDHLFSEYSLEPAIFDFDGVTVSTEERVLPTEQHGFEGFGREDRRRQVITYHIPFSGDPNLLACRPNPFVPGSVAVEASDNEVRFSIINLFDDWSRIKSEAERHLSLIREQSEDLNKNIEEYNKGLPVKAGEYFDSRKVLGELIEHALAASPAPAGGRPEPRAR